MNDDTNNNNNAQCADQHHDHHGHSHGASKRCSCRLTKTQSLIIMLCMTSSFFVVELVVGYITNSNSLVADAFHMLSDVISLIIGLVAVRFSKRQASARNTFGWVRAEVLGSLVNSVFLVALCFSIFVEAINRYFKPEPLEDVELMLIVGGVGLLINIIGLLIFGLSGHGHSHGGGSHGHSHGGGSDETNTTTDARIDTTVGISNLGVDIIEADVVEIKVETTESPIDKSKKKPRRARNMNIHGVFLHVLSDALGSVAVLISGILVKFAPPVNKYDAKWKLYIDPTLSILITIFITVSTIPLFKEASLVLLQTVPRQFDIENLKKLVSDVKGVLDVHHFHVWSLNSEKLVASAHLRVSKLDDTDDFDTLDEVKRLLHKNDIHATTLQLEYDDVKTCDYSYDFCEGDDCHRRQCCTTEKNAKNSDKKNNNNEITSAKDK